MITKENVEQFRGARKKQKLKESELTEEQVELTKEVLEISKEPVEMTDEDFKLSEGELDIRKLSKENREQLIFRGYALQLVYLRSLVQGQTDLMRMLMVLGDKLGVDNWQQALEEVILKSQKEAEK